MSTRKPSRSRPGSGRNGAGFFREESGAYTIFAIVGFAMLMVVIGLVVDVGRVMNVHSQASSYADRVALAAANELDGRPGALSRAVAAAQAIPVGVRLTLSGDDEVGISRLVFMSSPLAADHLDNPYAPSPLDGDNVTLEWSGDFSTPPTIEDDHEAQYVVVETTPEVENYLFFPIASVLMPDVRTSASVAPQAVAGFEHELCNSAPVMVCNPDESLGVTFNASVGRQLDVNLQSGLGWNSNDYSLLDVDSSVLSVNSTLLGIPLDIRLRNLIGQRNPGTACYANRVRPRSLLDLSLDLGLALGTPIGDLRAQIGDGFNDRYNDGREFPVVVVNCNQIPLLQSLLGVNTDIPIEAFARVRVLEAVGADLSLRLEIANRTRPPPGDEPDPLREYPVLVR